MKDKRFFANIDKDSVCFMVVVMLLMGVAVTVALDAGGIYKSGGERENLAQRRDGTNADLSVRTNMGDTLYVLGNKPRNNNCVYAMRPNGETGTFRFQGANRVNPGDTIVIDPEHKILMKNITQSNLAKQK